MLGYMRLKLVEYKIEAFSITSRYLLAHLRYQCYLAVDPNPVGIIDI